LFVSASPEMRLCGFFGGGAWTAAFKVTPISRFLTRILTFSDSLYLSLSHVTFCLLNVDKCANR
jgi:hypothetical protein